MTLPSGHLPRPATGGPADASEAASGYGLASAMLEVGKATATGLASEYAQLLGNQDWLAAITAIIATSFANAQRLLEQYYVGLRPSLERAPELQDQPPSSSGSSRQPSPTTSFPDPDPVSTLPTATNPAVTSASAQSPGITAFNHIAHFSAGGATKFTIAHNIVHNNTFGIGKAPQA